MDESVLALYFIFETAGPADATRREPLCYFCFGQLTKIELKKGDIRRFKGISNQRYWYNGGGGGGTSGAGVLNHTMIPNE